MRHHDHDSAALPAPLPRYPSAWDQARPGPAPEPAELTDEELALLLPLARRAAIDNMARRLGLTRTTEEDQR